MDENMQLSVGDEIIGGTYRIVRFIARGGMGEVFEAVNVHHESDRVAIKVMIMDLANDDTVSAMFDKEAQTLTRLSHPAIVQYRLATRDTEGKRLIVTEFIDGPSLEDQFGKMDLDDDQFGLLTIRLAAGLGAAHRLGAIHRDVSPDNVLLVDGQHRQPKIIDFGIARDVREGSEDKTLVGDNIAGKYKYIAPEQIGEYGRSIGPWTDLYSLALTMLAVAQGKHADMGGSLADVVRKRLSVPDLQAVPARYRPAFEAALQPNPVDRPQDMQAFIERLNHAAALRDDREKTLPPTPMAFPAASDQFGSLDTGMPPVEAASKPKQPTDPAQRKKLALLAGSAAGVIALVAIVAAVLPGGDAGDGEIVQTPVETPAPSTPETALVLDDAKFERLASRLAQEPECSWLSYEGPQGGEAVFSGVSGNAAATRTSLAEKFASVLDQDVPVDLARVRPIETTACSVLDAFARLRSDALMEIGPDTLEVTEQELSLSDGYPLGRNRYAEASFEVGGLRPGEDVILLIGIEPTGEVSLLPNDEFLKDITTAYQARDDGYVWTFPTTLSGDRPALSGLGVVAGSGGLATARETLPDLFANDDATRSPEWWTTFAETAQALGWRADMRWYVVQDEVPG